MPTITKTLIQPITPELSLWHYNDIPVLQLTHPVGNALIALQGAQLLQWIPKNATNSVFWLSDIEPFVLGKAIRGGVPICFPWFNNNGTPAHGYARIRLWQLTDYCLTDTAVHLSFGLFNDNHLIEAKMQMQFDEHCHLRFTHFNAENAQFALHSYFDVADLAQTQVSNLPTQCFNFLTQQEITVPSTRIINELTDCVYQMPLDSHLQIDDNVRQRQVHLHQSNASDTVLWNPYHKPTSAMSEKAYQQMLCLETARLHTPLPAGETVSVKISLR